MSKKDNNKWIDNTALFFYQIFSVDYENEKFENKLLVGGGGNSTLCSSWTQLSKNFIKCRISKKAYEELIIKIKEPDRDMIIKRDNCVTIPLSFTKKKYKKMFSSNTKGAKRRKNNKQYFHFDHSPCNKKILALIKQHIKEHKDKDSCIKSLSNYLRKIQTFDLITVEEDEIRYQADNHSPEKLTAKERDELIGSEFYDLILK